MPTLCTATATTSRGGNAVDVIALGGAGGTGYYLAEVDATVDASVMEALRPRGGVQRVGLRLYVRAWPPGAAAEGTRIDGELIGGWRVHRSLGQLAQSASFQLVNGALGSQASIPHVLTQGRHWDVKLAFRYGDDGAMVFPLMTFGKVDTSETTDTGTIVDNVAVVDAMFFAAGAETVQLPAGHGLTYAQVVSKLWDQHATGGDNSSPRGALPPIPADFQFRKEINLINGGAVELMAAIGDLVGTNYFINEDGYISGAVYAPEQVRGPVQGVIDERDILVGVNGTPEPITVRGMPTPISDICFEGQIQHVRENLGRRSLPLPSKSYATFAPKVARHQQTGGTVGAPTYSDTGTAEVVQDNGIRSESLTLIDIDQETVIGIQTAAKGYQNLSAARYTLEADLDLLPIAGVYVEAQEDGALAFAWNEERFIDQSYSAQSREFDDLERLKYEVQEQYSIHHRRAAIQQRAIRSDTWESVGGLAGTLCLGNGDGVAESRAVLRRTELKLVEHDASEDGYRTYRRTRIHTWDRAQGWEFRYGDSFESSDEEEQFRLTSDLEEWWSAVAGREDIHVYRWQERDYTGRVRAHGNETRQGFLEAAEVRTDLEPNVEDYDSTAEWQLAVAASRHDVQPMHVEMHYGPPGGVYNLMTASYELAQAPWQLANAGRRIFIKSRARTVTFSIPPNPLVKEGQWWRVRYRRPGIDVDHDAMVLDRTTEQRGNGGPVVQILTVAIH